jgi:hypothetical protein
VQTLHSGHARRSCLPSWPQMDRLAPSSAPRRSSERDPEGRSSSPKRRGDNAVRVCRQALGERCSTPPAAPSGLANCARVRLADPRRQIHWQALRPDETGADGQHPPRRPACYLQALALLPDRSKGGCPLQDPRTALMGKERPWRYHVHADAGGSQRQYRVEPPHR